MGTNALYCHEYAPKNILVRAQTRQLQILQNGTEVASIRYSGNSQVSFSQTGLMLYDSGRGNYLLDLNAPFPQEPVYCSRESLVALTPEGTRIVHHASERFPFKDSEGQEHRGLLVLDLDSKAVEQLWHGDTTQPREVYPFGEARYMQFKEWLRESWTAVTDPLEFPEIILGTDGQTWALLKANRVEIGRGSQRLGSVYWQGFSFHPEMAVFDASCERLILSGAPGIVALGLDGTPLAHWEGILPCAPFEEYGSIIDTQDAPVVSPIVFSGDDLLAVVRVAEEKGYGSKQRWFEVLCFDPQTLELRGQRENIPRRRDPDDEAALLPLADGSLAWMTRNLPVLIMPSNQNIRRSNEWLHVIGDEPNPVVPHPSEPWYDRNIGESGCIPGKLSEISPEQRASLARYLLNELSKDGRFDELIRYDLRAFAAYREQILTWPIARLKKLKEMAPLDYWKIVVNAPDVAIDLLAQTLEKTLPHCNELQMMLLIGCDTPRSREHLGDMARQSNDVANLCRRHLLEVSESGAVIRRFSPHSLNVIAYTHRDDDAEFEHDAGLAFLLSTEQFLEQKHGLACKAPLRHLLTTSFKALPDDLIPNSLTPCHHWFISPCESCNESGFDYVFRFQKHREQPITLLGSMDEFGQLSVKPDEHSCEGECGECDSQKNVQLKLEPYCPDAQPRRPRIRQKRVGCLGGQPEWLQTPRIPHCPECGRMMFYVGQIKAGALDADVMNATLYGFQCEHCSIGTQICQIT